MKMQSVEQQITTIRSNIRFAAHMHKWFLGSAALGVIASIVFWHPVPLMISVFLAIIGFSEKRAGPNIVAAIFAYDSDTPTCGEVSIVIKCWDTDNHYHATVHEKGHPDWEYKFVPQGWLPTSRSYPAKIWRFGNKGQPILAIAEEGIMIPRDDPKPIEKQSGTTTHA